MEDILLSVVIPTYNRYEYLKGCLEVTASIESPQLEIVVQDNTADNSEILPIIAKLNDKRIKYYHVEEHISVVDNCNLAVRHANGKYVFMIGDDDTICESMIDAAKFCLENNIEACMALIPGFNWPGMTFAEEREPNFFVWQRATGEVEIINVPQVLEHAINSAEGLSDDMPRVYHGMVSKTCLDRIYKKCGTYFPGPSPDMANATAVSLVVNKAVFIHDYLMVSGYGKKSARGEGNRKEHFGVIGEKPWLPKDTEKRWYKNVPKVFSAETIFAQSMLDALDRMGRKDLVKKYKYGRLYAMFFSHHPAARRYMVSFLLKKPYRMCWFIAGAFHRLRIRKRLLNNRITEYYYKNDSITSLEQAQKMVNELRVKNSIEEYKWK